MQLQIDKNPMSCAMFVIAQFKSMNASYTEEQLDVYRVLSTTTSDQLFDEYLEKSYDLVKMLVMREREDAGEDRVNRVMNLIRFHNIETKLLKPVFDMLHLAPDTPPILKERNKKYHRRKMMQRLCGIEGASDLGIAHFLTHTAPMLMFMIAAEAKSTDGSVISTWSRQFVLQPYTLKLSFDYLFKTPDNLSDPDDWQPFLLSLAMFQKLIDATDNAHSYHEHMGVPKTPEMDQAAQSLTVPFKASFGLALVQYAALVPIEKVFPEYMPTLQDPNWVDTLTARTFAFTRFYQDWMDGPGKSAIQAMNASMSAGQQ